MYFLLCFYPRPLVDNSTLVLTRLPWLLLLSDMIISLLLILSRFKIIFYSLLHLWLKFITFMVSQIITFMVKFLLHLWSVIYYIYG